MTAIDLLRGFLGINPIHFTKVERLILEADLLLNICHELKNIFREQYFTHSNDIYFVNEMENDMDLNYIRFAVNDILSSGEYTLSGIAYYTHTPEEVVYEIVTGSNIRPAAIFLERIIELHREVKNDMYLSIREKIIKKYFMTNCHS